MAVGARASDVLQQFLIEAVLVCTVGGALGVALSLMIAFILQLFLPGWEIGFSPLALLTAFLCSTLTGVLFGWLPARNAARLDPVDARRENRRGENKNASQKDWHFISRMYTMKQKSYAAVSASTGTITLA